MSTKTIVSVMFSDFIRAESGDNAAVFETRVQVAQSAVFHLLASNNKTQWNMVTAACKLYSNIKECAAALKDEKTGKVPAVSAAAVKKMHGVYLAYGAAIKSLELPAFVKGRPVAEIDAFALEAGLQVATLVTSALTVAPKEPVTEEAKAEKAKAKAEKEAKAKAETQLAIDTEAARIAGASVVTLPDMVAIVANAIKNGMLDAELLAMLDSALDSVAVSVDYVPMSDVVPAEMHG